MPTAETVRALRKKEKKERETQSYINLIILILKAMRKFKILRPLTSKLRTLDKIIQRTKTSAPAQIFKKKNPKQTGLNKQLQL